jgi:hypothetical protein
MSPRACRIAPRRHEGAPIQRSAARLRERRKIASSDVSPSASIFLAGAQVCAG